jgi:hypothetical protein
MQQKQSNSIKEYYLLIDNKTQIFTTGRKYSYSIVTDQPIKDIEPSRYHSKAQISTFEGQVTLYSNSIT